MDQLDELGLKSRFKAGVVTGEMSEAKLIAKARHLAADCAYYVRERESAAKAVTSKQCDSDPSTKLKWRAS